MKKSLMFLAFLFTVCSNLFGQITIIKNDTDVCLTIGHDFRYNKKQSLKNGEELVFFNDQDFAIWEYNEKGEYTSFDINLLIESSVYNFSLVVIKKNEHNEYYFNLIDFKDAFCEFSKLMKEWKSSRKIRPKVEKIISDYLGDVTIANFIKYIKEIELENKRAQEFEKEQNEIRQKLRQNITILMKRIEDAPIFNETEKAKTIKTQMLTLWTQAMSPEMFTIDKIKEKILNFEKSLNDIPKLVAEERAIATGLAPAFV